MDKSSLIAIDVPNMAHRFYHASQGKVSACHAVLRELTTLSMELDSTHFCFCFDDKVSARKLLHPHYKANRRHDDSRAAINASIDKLRTQLLPDLGFSNIFWAPGLEADDLMAMIDCEERVVLVSTDKDLYQLITDDDFTTVWNPYTKMLWTWALCKERTGVSVDDWIEFKCLMGDKADNIPGLPGVGEILARKYINSELEKDKHDRIQNMVYEFADRMTENRNLIELPWAGADRNIEPIVTRDHVSPSHWDTIVSKYSLYGLIGRCPFQAKEK